MIKQIIAKLQRLDQQIRKTDLEVQVCRQDENTKRAIFLEGRKDGLGNAYRTLQSLVENTPEFEQWAKEYFDSNPL